MATACVYFAFPPVELVCKDLAHPGQRQLQNKCLYRDLQGDSKPFNFH